MDQNFQTSFIPKKPIIKKQSTLSSSVNYFSIFSIFIFFTMIIATGALYFYNGVLTKNIVKMKNNLSLAQNRFEPSKIIQLRVLDKRLRASDEILSKHIAISPIFKVLQSMTMKNVGYTKFNYHFDDSKNKKIIIKMKGIAIGYKSIALQSDLLAKNKYLINPVFSNLLLDDKGNVLFDLEFSVDPNFIDYKNMLKTIRDNFSNVFSLNNKEILN